MNDKIDIRICTGTTCYVMGASELLTLEEILPPEHLSRIRISGSPCLGLCTERKLKPPFVQINGRIISGATPEMVKNAVTAEIEGGKYAYDK